MWGSLREDWAVHCLPFGFGSVLPTGVGVTRRRWRRGGPCEASSSGSEQPDELLPRQADEVVRPMGADLGDRVEGHAPNVRADVREDRREVRNPALAGVPPAPEPAQAQEEQCLLLETEDGQDRPAALDSAPGSEREDLRRAISGSEVVPDYQPGSFEPRCRIGPPFDRVVDHPTILSLALPGHRSSGSRVGRGHLKVHRLPTAENLRRTPPRINA